MKNILSFGAVCALTLSVAACASNPDRCIDDLDCGVGAYSEERTVGGYEQKPMKKSSIKEETPMAEKAPVMEKEVVVQEPIKGTADAMFDERLVK